MAVFPCSILPAERLFTDYEAKLGVPLARDCGYDALIDSLEATFSSGKPGAAEIVWPDQRVFAALLTPIDGEGCVALLHDISHFKVLERVKNEFISTATHDLKNPIGVITGFSDLLPKAGPLNEAQAGFVAHINSAARNMNELVQNLLQLAKIDMGMESKQETVALNGLAHDVWKEYQPQAAAKTQKLLLEKAESQPNIQGDSLQLKQALRNLVGNAVKYTPAGWFHQPLGRDGWERGRYPCAGYRLWHSG